MLIICADKRYRPRHPASANQSHMSMMYTKAMLYYLIPCKILAYSNLSIACMIKKIWVKVNLIAENYK